MKMLRHLPDDPGEMVQRLTTYRKGSDEYTVLETAGGRFIFLNEGGEGSNVVDPVRDVLQQEEVQDGGQSQEAGSVDRQDQGVTVPAGISVPDMPSFSPDQHTVVHHSVPGEISTPPGWSS